MQKAIANSAEFSELEKIGYQTTWYQMPEIYIELKMSLYYEETETIGNSKHRLLFTPFNAKYQNSYNYKSEGSSSIKIKIVPVPQSTGTEKT